MTEFFSGQTIPVLKVIEVQAIGAPGSASVSTFPLLTITLENVQISSYHLQDSSGAKSTEQISFKYEKATITSTPVSATGTPGTPVTITWDPTLFKL